MAEDNTELERSIREAFESGRIGAAAQATLLGYGYEIRRFLQSRLRTRHDALEVYSMFTEDLWTSLPKFGWRCSMRSWSYTLARNACVRYLQAIRRHAQRHVPWPPPEGLPQLLEPPVDCGYVDIEGVLTERFHSLRQQLDRADQELLALRVDARMAWKDVASLRLTVGNRDRESIARESARLRKAFERIKVELRQLAKRDERVLAWRPAAVPSGRAA